jgi:hypothetical protein
MSNWSKLSFVPGKKHETGEVVKSGMSQQQNKIA